MSAKPTERTLEYWEQRWTDNNIQWHELEGNDLLKKNFDRILSESFPNKEAKDMKIFVPLCGKSQDMCMFYKRGFTVVGIEYAGKGIREFFEENNLKTKEKDTNSLFTESTDGRLMIGEGDLFSFTTQSGNIKSLPHTKYDIIWDRGSFEAMNLGDREKYSEFIKPLLGDTGIHLISSPSYNTEEYGGPPTHTTKEDLEDLFGDQLTVKFVSSRDCMADGSPDKEKWIGRGLTRMCFSLYAMTRKQNVEQPVLFL